MNNMKTILDVYEHASGQQINFQKSEIFYSKNVPPGDRDSIASGLGVNVCLGTGRYLGLPSMIGRSKKSLFKFIKDRVWKRINSWGGRSLSKAGKEVMIKSVLQSIPTYFMSLFLIPSTLCDEIQSLISGFWWGGSSSSTRGIHWLSWDKLCIDKDHGGLGFRNLNVFNIALLGKQGWRLMSYPDSLVARLYKAKYYPRCDFMHASKGSNSSFVWRSIHEARLVLKEGCRWMIGDGRNVSVFGDRWLANRMILDETSTLHYNHFLRVADLIIAGTKVWNVNVINDLFPPDVVDHIMRTPLFTTVAVDSRTWWPDMSGEYSVRSAYRFITNHILDTDHLFVEADWRRLWKMKVPPKVKHFMWRLCREALSTRSNLQRRHMDVENICPWCSLVPESALHLFIYCPKAHACWSSLGIIDTIMDCALSAADFCVVFFSVLSVLQGPHKEAWCMTLWSLWQSRNDRIWENKQEDAVSIIWRGNRLLQDWVGARAPPTPIQVRSQPPAPVVSWRCPRVGFLKCNVDAAFSLVANRVGIGMCLRDEHGHFIKARTCSYSPILEVPLGEALGLYGAITWVRELGYIDVIFELDAKFVVDAFNSGRVTMSEFGSILSSCKTLLSSFTCNSHVEFARREANKVAHSLAGVALLSADPQDYPIIPSCISTLIINEMH